MIIINKNNFNKYLQKEQVIIVLFFGGRGGYIFSYWRDGVDGFSQIYPCFIKVDIKLRPPYVQKKTGKISIFIEGLSRSSVFFGTVGNHKICPSSKSKFSFQFIINNLSKLIGPRQDATTFNTIFYPVVCLKSFETLHCRCVVVCHQYPSWGGGGYREIYARKRT